jgi:hypothetical protein
MLLSGARFKLTCLECDYMAYFEDEPLARSAAQMHIDLGKRHQCVLDDRSRIDGFSVVPQAPSRDQYESQKSGASCS